MAPNPRKARKKGRTAAIKAALRRRKARRIPKRRLATINRSRTRTITGLNATALRRKRSELSNEARNAAVHKAENSKDESASGQRLDGARNVQARASSNPIGGTAGRM